MTSILCALTLWQPVAIPPVPKDVRGVVIETGQNWFEVTLKREGEDWEDVLPDRVEEEGLSCFFAGCPWGGLDFKVIFSHQNKQPCVEVLKAEELVLPGGATVLDEAHLNNFGLHQTF